MRKVVAFLGASLCLAWVAPARAQAPDMFKDLDRSHWAYEAVESLRSKGIVIGYPDGFFRGRRTLTRYEFAVALDRALKQFQGSGGQGTTGETGPPGPAGEAGPQGPPGMTPQEVEDLKKLTNEFREELSRLGNNIAAINRRLDQLAKDVGDIQDTLRKMPKIGGGVFWGVRSDNAHGGYIDRDGRPLGTTPPGQNHSRIFQDPVPVHQFHLGVDANLAGGTTVSARIVSDNYKSYLNSSFGQITALGSRFGGGGPLPDRLNVNPASDTYVDRLEVKAGLSTFGRESGLTIGRFAHQVSKLTLWKPDVDTYFNNPLVDDGMYRMDGFRIDTGAGSVGIQLFGARLSSVQGTNGVPYSTPLAGIPATAAGQVIFAGAPNGAGNVFKPAGQPNQGQMTVDQIAGVSLTLGHHLMDGGSIRFTAIDTSNKASIGAGIPGAGFNNVLILGAGLDLTVAERLKINGEWSKTNIGTGITNTKNAGNNNAFLANVGYGSGGLDVSVGYKYIDPLFYAPGYWGRIGNWLNPTNIQGPMVRAAYDFSDTLGINVGGDYYTAARRMDPVGMAYADRIARVLVGVRWDLSRNIKTTVDWEGVFYNLGAGRFGNPGGRVHPTENYITLGAGYTVNESTTLQLGYQLGDFNGHGALGGGPGIGTRYNYNTLTGGVSVKF